MKSWKKRQKLTRRIAEYEDSYKRESKRHVRGFGKGVHKPGSQNGRQ